MYIYSVVGKTFLIDCAKAGLYRLLVLAEDTVWAEALELGLQLGWQRWNNEVLS
jgi:hypothetical protein